jgi:hypothetical protein
MPFLWFTALFALAYTIFYQASASLYTGADWANEVCSTSQTLCTSPQWLLYASGASVIVFVGLRIAQWSR